ncbi:MAG: hypothetical protein IT372_29255, partial [Polyangiaceae bacterium]|nr:hypothetical protein [Polyangiaceae bacterium]
MGKVQKGAAREGAGGRGRAGPAAPVSRISPRGKEEQRAARRRAAALAAGQEIARAYHDRARRRERQNDVLVALAADPALRGDDDQAALRKLTETAARTLGVERVGLWWFDEDRARIRCLDLFEQSARRHSAGQALVAA